MKKSFKKNLFLSSFVALIWLGWTAMSYGAAIVSVTPDQISSPAAGEQLHLNIQITGGRDVAGYKLTIGFDPTALRYIDTIVWTVLSCQDFRSGVKYGLSTLLHL